MGQQRHSLVEIPVSYGSDIYAVYYIGSFPAYAPLRGSVPPIYVGQAARTVNNARTPLEEGPRLRARLSSTERA